MGVMNIPPDGLTRHSDRAAPSSLINDKRAWGRSLQLGFETGQDLSKHFNDLGGAQTLQPYTNYGRPLCPRDSQDRVEVRVERHNYRISSQRESKHLLIGGFFHSYHTHVHTVMSETAQRGGRVAGNSLIQNQAHGGPVKPRCFPSRCPQGSRQRMPAPA